jgi:hypothetical protein
MNKINKSTNGEGLLVSYPVDDLTQSGRRQALRRAPRPGRQPAACRRRPYRLERV